jgi:hypothetical protein
MTPQILRRNASLGKEKLQWNCCEPSIEQLRRPPLRLLVLQLPVQQQALLQVLSLVDQENAAAGAAAGAAAAGAIANKFFQFFGLYEFQMRTGQKFISLILINDV